MAGVACRGSRRCILDGVQEYIEIRTRKRSSTHRIIVSLMIFGLVLYQRYHASTAMLKVHIQQTCSFTLASAQTCHFFPSLDLRERPALLSDPWPHRVRRLPHSHAPTLPPRKPNHHHRSRPLAHINVPCGTLNGWLQRRTSQTRGRLQVSTRDDQVVEPR